MDKIIVFLKFVNYFNRLIDLKIKYSANISKINAIANNTTWLHKLKLQTDNFYVNKLRYDCKF